MAFTTWAALKSELLDDLASGRWKVKSYQIGDISRSFVTVDELLRMISYVENKAAAETLSVSGRTYAKQGGRG